MDRKTVYSPSEPRSHSREGVRQGRHKIIAHRAANAVLGGIGELVEMPKTRWMLIFHALVRFERTFECKQEALDWLASLDYPPTMYDLFEYTPR